MPIAQPEPGEDRHTVILRELAGMTLRLCRDLQNRALEAESSDEATRLAIAFHRVSRGLRQTLALELKLVRYKDGLLREAADRDALARARLEAEQARALAPGGAVWKRKEAVASQVERLIFDEYDPTDWDDGSDDEETVAYRRHQSAIERTFDRFSDWLQDAAARPDFTTADLDDLIVEGCEACGVDPARLYDFGEGQGAAESEAEPPPSEPPNSS
ncbi:hypothetical protein [Phenylobacterium sp. J367]|uniref:hypothetical protein n=1 Tax=Phenylobacterium sp. J367 TaxID=2898435 RepID=UPI002151A9AB|nr:hypothetical protein [Phenylobacterium sp. J367]MCR5880605.1 hypothetical protein [Phenylobacterium sp. J367]